MPFKLEMALKDPKKKKMPLIVVNVIMHSVKLLAVGGHTIRMPTVLFVGHIVWSPLPKGGTSSWWGPWHMCRWGGGMFHCECSWRQFCDFHYEVAAEILIDDAIQCFEEGQDEGDEVLLQRWKSNLFSHPKICFGLLVHFPDVIVFDGNKDKMMMMGIGLKKWFGGKIAFHLGNLVLW